MSTTMKAVRVVGYHQPLEIDEIELRLARPSVVDPVDVEAEAVFEPVDRDRRIGAEAANVDVGVRLLDNRPDNFQATVNTCIVYRGISIAI